MNSMLRNYIAVEGREAALKVASALIEQNYQVMIQLDDCNIYIVAYEDNDPSYGSNQFASISPEEIEDLQFKPNVGLDEKKYRQYRFVSPKEIEILLSPTNRLDDISEKYKKAS